MDRSDPFEGGTLTFCNRCGKELNETDEFCSKCGAQHGTTSKKFCTACGTELDPEAGFCAKCGTARGADSAQQQQKQQIQQIYYIISVHIRRCESAARQDGFLQYVVGYVG